MEDDTELLIVQLETALLTAQAIGSQMTAHLLRMALLDLAAPGKLPGQHKIRRAVKAERRRARPLR